MVEEVSLDQRVEQVGVGCGGRGAGEENGGGGGGGWRRGKWGVVRRGG